MTRWSNNQWAPQNNIIRSHLISRKGKRKGSMAFTVVLEGYPKRQSRVDIQPGVSLTSHSQVSKPTSETRDTYVLVVAATHPFKATLNKISEIIK